MIFTKFNYKIKLIYNGIIPLHTVCQGIVHIQALGWEKHVPTLIKNLGHSILLKFDFPLTLAPAITTGMGYKRVFAPNCFFCI